MRPPRRSNGISKVSFTTPPLPVGSQKPSSMAVSQLKQFPEMGVSIGAKTGYETDLRMLVVEGYIALYRIETEVVSIGRIINAQQDYIRILLGEVTPCHSP